MLKCVNLPEPVDDHILKKNEEQNKKKKNNFIPVPIHIHKSFYLEEKSFNDFEMLFDLPGFITGKEDASR